MNDIPELLPPHLTPPIRNDADLQRLWKALMGPYGQDRRNLWFLLLHADGRPTPFISRVDDVPEHPDRIMVRNLIDMFKRVLPEFDPGGSAAVLLTRKGWAVPHGSDLAWAADLAAEARRRRLSLHPSFLATDEDVVILRPADSVSEAAA
jgi:hypothetical protein